MRKILLIFWGALSWFNTLAVYASEKFEILPDLPEPLQAAQATSITTNDATSNLISAQQSIGQEPNWGTLIFSLIFVVVLIYALGIIFTKLNKFGINTLKQQMGDTYNSKATVISTTPLGTNKTLHVVELDGKRMLIGASANSIDLIKDLGSYPPTELDESAYSKIEIPNIRIPKIEIPKIEFPNIGFTKAVPKSESDINNSEKEENQEQSNSDEFEISEIYQEGPDGIIDELFKTNTVNNSEIGEKEEKETKITEKHMVDPEEYALYKKYL